MKKKLMAGILIMSMLISSALVFAEDTPEGENPTETESEVIGENEGYGNEEDDDDEEELEAPVITDIKTGERKVTFTYESKGAKSYNYTFGTEDQDYFEDITTKKTITFKNLMPGKKYMLTLYAEGSETDEEEISDDTIEYVTIPSEHNMNVYSRKKAVSEVAKVMKSSGKMTPFFVKSGTDIDGIIKSAANKTKIPDYVFLDKKIKYDTQTTVERDSDDERITINGVKYTKVKLSVKRTLSKSKEKKFNKKLNKVAKKLNKGSKKTKVKNIIKYIKKHNVNKTKTPYGSTAYGALIRGKSNCKGQAALFYMLCRKMNIKCKIAYGMFHEELLHRSDMDSGHYINIVKIGKKWYYADAHTRHALYGKTRALKKKSGYPLGLVVPGEKLSKLKISKKDKKLI